MENIRLVTVSIGTALGALTHAHNLALANRVPRTSKALAPLSGDLLEALRGSAPSSAAASRAPREWFAGRQSAFRDSMELSAVVTARGKDHQPQRALPQLPQSKYQRSILADIVPWKLLREALDRLQPSASDPQHWQFF